LTGRRIALWNVLTVAGLLLLLEGASRVFAPTPFSDPVIADGHPDWEGTRVYDPLLFWRMLPNTTRDGRMLTNARGLRGPDFGEKGEAEFRILSLGESTTFAGKLPYHECYSAVLERELGTVDGKHVHVVNAGVPAYSLFQGVRYLEREGPGLRPDAVMIYFGFNDFLPVADRVARDAGADGATDGMTDRELYETRDTWRTRVTYALQRRSNLARALSFGRSGAKGADPEGTRAVPSQRPRVPEEDRRRLLAELRSWCGQRGVRLVVVIPWYYRFEDHVPLLREVRPGGEGDVVVVDLPAALPRRSASHFRDDVHPNAAGHREIARVVADALRAAWNVEEGEWRNDTGS